MGGLDRNGTNITQVCAEFTVCILWYHSRLSWLCWDLSWSNHIPYQKCVHWVWNLYLLAPFVVLFSHLRDLEGNNTRYFLPYQLQITLSHNTNPYFSRLVLVDWCIWKCYEHIRYYVVNSSYMLNIRPKISENESPENHPLRFTQGYVIDQILWYENKFIS